MPHLVGRGPEAHPLDPGGRIRIARRRVLDERGLEYGGPLSLVGADVVKHDPPQARSHLVQSGEEHPRRPLRFWREARPVDLHSVMHLLVAPFRVGAGQAERYDIVASRLFYLEAGTLVDAAERERLVREARRPIGVVPGLNRRHAARPFRAVVFELDRMEVRRDVWIAQRPVQRAAT